jgi:RNA polymerase sigma-70 factor (ECF subfamily)
MQEFSGMIRGMLYRLVGPTPELEDLQQTVFLRMLLGLRQVRETHKLSSWVGSICVNVARDHLRRKKVRALTEDSSGLEPEGATETFSTQSQVEARESLQRCRKCLEKLSVNQRTAFVLRVLGHSVDEIAEMMNAARSTTRLRLYWARKAFAKAIGSEEFSPQVVLLETLGEKS